MTRNFLKQASAVFTDFGKRLTLEFNVFMTSGWDDPTSHSSHVDARNALQEFKAKRVAQRANNHS